MASSDIVERLRLWPHVDCAGDMIDEAAAEIERLRAAHDHQYNMAGLMLREAERVRRENENLRALLREALDRETRYVLPLYRDENYMARVRRALGIKEE